MPDETITVSPLDNPDKKLPYSRQQYYLEQFCTTPPPDGPAVHIVNIMLFDTSGDLIIQKRAQSKNHNPGLFDKSLGGHVTYGDNSDYTAMIESVQELLTPSIVLPDETDFDKALHLLKPYVDTVAIILKKSVELWKLTKLHDGQAYVVPNVVHLYFGVYGGKMRPANREVAGILYYSLEQLNAEMRATPDLFTNDLKQILAKYHDEIVAFSDRLKKI